MNYAQASSRYSRYADSALHSSVRIDYMLREEEEDARQVIRPGPSEPDLPRAAASPGTSPHWRQREGLHLLHASFRFFTYLPQLPADRNLPACVCKLEKTSAF